MEYQIMFYGGLAGAVVSLLISIVVFIKLNIKIVLEDLLGFRFSKLVSRKKNRGGQTEKPITKEIVLRKKAVPGEIEPTVLLEKEAGSTPLAETAILHEEIAATTILTDDAGEIMLLTEEASETTLLTEDEAETTLLTEGVDQPTVLTEEQVAFFKKDIEIIVVHSEKIIS